MNRQLRLYIVYGSPLALFFIVLVAMNMGVGFNLVLSFVIAAVMALIEFFILKFVFTRVFPPH
ncbi:hypothetical protein [Litorimonas sp. WD9-15]|uniref:hypothetical protein n=1 Tax=Litorimonas sp. WD9-15 TaxID=3418716 RepID=UPI003D0805BB